MDSDPPSAKAGALPSADGTVYTHPGVMSAQMQAYWEPAARRIEDCGTRHVPTHGGQRLYGQGALVIKIDMQGRLLEIDIAVSSGNTELDSAMRRIIAASAPFGRPPDIVRKDSNARALSVGIVQRFRFTRDTGEVDPLPPDAQCRWPAGNSFGAGAP